MEVQIRSRNLEVTDRLREYVNKKTRRLDRYMPKISELTVDLEDENTRSTVGRYVAQITLRDERGTILRAEERTDDMFSSIDAVVDKINRQIDRYRGKRISNRRDTDEAAFEPLAEEVALLVDEAEEGNIVRRKRFPLHPMSTEEAIEQMELLGHDFFVFFNHEEEAVNVVYRRHDGNYGLLLPELD
ncbi:MAG: ribosome-associated translation inhibitor RaiA [Chloroflexi bacterium]|jgi:putative sigma-54 modulation protein|nr:ribosome-associated translation inhibitor RaiA [Chloroflexota bacterium]